MILHAPTWTAIASIEREAPDGRARHASAGTVARLVRSAWLSFVLSIPTPRNASSISVEIVSIAVRVIARSRRASLVRVSVAALDSDAGLVVPGPRVDPDRVALADED